MAIHFDDDLIAETTSDTALDQGRRLFHAGWVSELMRRDEGPWRRLRCLVRSEKGNPRAAPIAIVTFDVNAAEGMLHVDCTADGAYGCAHLAAVMLYFRDAPGDGQNSLPARTEKTPQIPKWRRSLDRILPEQQGEGEPVALLLEIHRHTPSPSSWLSEPARKSPYLALRPAVRGTRGTWIRSRVEWNRTSTTVQADHAAIVAEFVDLARLAQNRGSSFIAQSYELPLWLPADALPSRGLWSLLDSAVAAGVQLVYAASTEQPAIRLLDEPVRILFDGRRARKRLRLAPMLEINGTLVDPGDIFFFGDPAVGVAWTVDQGTKRETLVLAPTTAPITPELRELFGSPLSIPESEEKVFIAAYLPRLRSLAPITSGDGSFEDEGPLPPTLVLSLQHADVPGAEIEWSWRYGEDDLARSVPLHSSATSVERDPAAEAVLLQEIRRALDGADFLWTAAGDVIPEQTLTGTQTAVLMADVLPMLRGIEHVIVEERGSSPQYRAADEAPRISIAVDDTDQHDWFDLDVSVSIEGEIVPFVELFAALSREEQFFLLPNGVFFPLDGPEFATLRSVIEEAKTLNDRDVDSLRIGRYQVDLWQELVALGVEASQSRRWRGIVDGLSDTALLEAVEPPEEFTATLRGYQEAGLSWLHFLRTNGLGGVLGDDMGLGKTIQAIAMMAIAHEAKPDAAPFLVVAPTSVVGNWAHESRAFAPHLRVLTVTETERRRGFPLHEAVEGMHIVVTSYALFRLEFEDYQAIEWSGLLLDEAQMIKNHTSRGYRCARLLDVPFKLAITGTPMENNLLELWALVSLTCPGLLGGLKHFTEYYRNPIEREHDAPRLQQLQRRLRPFLLRRTKELVATDLPPKQEQILELDLHPAHRKIYDTRLQRERQKVLGLVENFDANRFQIFSSLTMLRQLALDATLGDDADTGADVPSAKLDALLEIVSEAVAEGHKVLVFSQFTRFLGRARDRATAAGISSAYLDGSTSRRAAVIDTFTSGGAPVFFVSLKAGGFGLNLTEADYCILLDPWWNPATEAQAIDRTHRIGQTRPVMVYRLVSKDTIESKVMALKAKKANLFGEVMDSTDGEVSSLSADDIRALLD